MPFLILRTGQAKGASWPITETPLVIGRERSCGVSLPDSLVSRRHCEILLQDQIIELKDLGSSNATLVNGEPVHDFQLHFGDEVTVGRTVFEVVQAVPQAKDIGPESQGHTTISLAEGQAVYLADDRAHELGEASPHLLHDLIQLFRYSRAFSRVESVDNLTATLAEALIERFDPLQLWIARIEGESEDPHLVQVVAQPETAREDFPEEPLWKALHELRGFLVPERVSVEDKTALQLTLVAPVHFANIAVAVVALRTHSRHRVYDESDLHFLLSLANTVAPFFGALEQRAQLRHEVQRLRHARQESLVLVGDSLCMREVRGTIQEVAGTVHPVLIVGETGTGKEIVANLIHGLSDRTDGPFVAVNCGAIPKELFESELFGHEKGAFTGATSRKIGLMEQSDRGTLFLDEIGELTLEHQASILRSLETKRFRRVGGKEEIASDFRIVAATNRDIHQTIEDGAFRRDLFHRLCGIEILILPLRERREDIAPLALRFLEIACWHAKHPVSGFEPDALEFLRTQPWPGNARELKYCVETAVTFSKQSRITLSDLQTAMPRHSAGAAPPTFAEAEERLIHETLAWCNGNVIEAAKHLGVGKDTIYRRLAQYKEGQ